MRVLMMVTFAGAALLASCQPSVEFDPDDPAIVATLEAIVDEAMEGSRNVDADRVLAMAEGEGELTFITGDVMLSGLDYIRESFQDTYAGLERQSNTIVEKRVRILSPNVAILIATSEGTYTDKAGWTSELVGMGHTIVFVREDGDWRVRHAHQSIAP
ncbi:MAG: SgcJ/EcaC family oxidoreductase [Gemmatimonadetes bacterium]|nr:SgcJ/EcaC family oxidoreductase [Gemmatimonadota bacterium]